MWEALQTNDWNRESTRFPVRLKNLSLRATQNNPCKKSPSCHRLISVARPSICFLPARVSSWVSRFLGFQGNIRRMSSAAVCESPAKNLVGQDFWILSCLIQVHWHSIAQWFLSARDLRTELRQVVFNLQSLCFLELPFIHRIHSMRVLLYPAFPLNSRW